MNHPTASGEEFFLIKNSTNHSDILENVRMFILRFF